jgi:superfamily II DNA or RNA helicase
MELTNEQSALVDELMDRTSTLLKLPTGYGKTTVALHVAQKLVTEEGLRVLIAAPARVVSHWAHEAEAWHLAERIQASHTDEPTYALWADGLLIKRANIAMVSHNVLPKVLSGQYGEYDALILDEVTRYRQPGSTGVKAVRSAHKRHAFDLRIGLTATPVAEDLMGLYGMAVVLDAGNTFGGSYEAFKTKYFFPTDYQQRNWAIKGEAEKNALMNRLVTHLLVTREDRKAESLPAIKYRTLPADRMSEEAYRVTEALRKDGECYVRNRRVTPPNSAVLQDKLRQVQQGFIYLGEDDSTETLVIDDVRVQQVRRLIDVYRRSSGSPLVVVYEYRAFIEALLPTLDIPYDRLDGSTTKVQQKKVITKWREGHGQLCFLHPKSAGHGVDGLQFSASDLLLVAPIWSNDQFEQVCGRLWRQGQTRPVTVYTIMAEDTVEAVVQAKQQGKSEWERELTEYLTKKSPQRTGG